MADEHHHTARPRDGAHEPSHAPPAGRVGATKPSAERAATLATSARRVRDHVVSRHFDVVHAPVVRLVPGVELEVAAATARE
jgi:hypothetical protein